MKRFTQILKRELRSLARLVIAFVALVIMLIVSVVVFPVYLCSRLSRNHKRSINRKKNDDA